MFTLWVWLHVGRHQLGKGTQVAYVCVLAAAFRHEDQFQTHQAGFKEWNVAVTDRRDEKATLVSAFPMYVFQRCHLMKIWDLITFSSVFILSALFPNLMPNQTLLSWSWMEPPEMQRQLLEAVPAGLKKKGPCVCFTENF